MHFNDTSFIYRIMGVDNGSTHMGVVIADLNLRTGQYHIQHVETYRGDRLAKDVIGLSETHSALWARQMMLREAFYHTLVDFEPHAVAVEAPFFMPGRVTTFQALSETMVFIKMAVSDYDPAMPTHLITPGQAKRAVQTKDFTMKKVVIPECVVRLPNITYNEGIDKYGLTEHEYDGIAVAKAHGDLVRKETGYDRS